MTDRIEPTDRTRLHRQVHKANFDRSAVNAILDEAPLAYVAFNDREQPYALPTLHVRIGDKLYLHGSSAGRMVRQVGGGAPVCITATILDGLVLARAAFGQSMNYRSVVVLARGTPVDDRERKLQVLRAVTEKVVPGRWDDVRHPTDNELKATAVVEFPIEEASAKIRTGPPNDTEEDLASDTWGGVIPVRMLLGEPQPDETSTGIHEVPDYIGRYLREARTTPDDNGDVPRSAE